MTPAMVHQGHAAHILAHRQVVLYAAYSAHPERFVRKPPKLPELPFPGLDQPASFGGKYSLKLSRRVSHC